MPFALVYFLRLETKQDIAAHQGVVVIVPIFPSPFAVSNKIIGMLDEYFVWIRFICFTVEGRGCVEESSRLANEL